MNKFLSDAKASGFDLEWFNDDEASVYATKANRNITKELTKFAELQTQQWISVEDRLPKRGSGELLVTRNTMFQPLVCSAVYEDGQWLRLRCPENGKPYGWAGCDVTHWMPLPSPHQLTQRTHHDRF